MKVGEKESRRVGEKESRGEGELEWVCLVGKVGH